MDLNRRDFLKKAAGIGTVAIAGYSLSTCSRKSESMLGLNWHVNDAFHLTPTDDHSIELYCNDGKGNKISHTFTGLEADMLTAIKHKRPLDEQIGIFAGKHQLSEKACRKQILSFLKDQEDAKIIYSGEKMLVYKSEKNG